MRKRLLKRVSKRDKKIERRNKKDKKCININRLLVLFLLVLNFYNVIFLNVYKMIYIMFFYIKK